MKNVIAVFICLCLMLYMSGCTSNMDGGDISAELSVSKYSEETDKYYEETANGYKAALYKKEEITVEKIENWIASCPSGEEYYQFIYSDPDSWDMFIYYSPANSDLRYTGFSFSIDDSTVKIYVANDGSLNGIDTEEDYILIRVQAPSRGAWPSSSELYVDDEKVEMQSNDFPDDKVTSDEVIDFVSNPYADFSERSDYWRYDLFEIFRNTEMVDFDNTLDYEKDYSHVITSEEHDDVLHEFKCKITLPQTTSDEPWAEQINSYYQGILPELIAEGDDIWNEYFNDWYIQKSGYYYENAYRYDNIITVVRSRDFYGSRPSIGWEPCADLFSALDGRKLSLDDLFCVGRDEYLPVLQTLLLDATVYGEDYKPTFQSGIAEHLGDASIAATAAGLVFIYPTGFVDAMASGTVFLNVSYEDLRDLLSPVYFPNYVG